MRLVTLFSGKEFVRVICIMIASSGFFACSAMNKLSTGASMRVEVEVYKGPLSKEPQIQWGELFGMVKDAQNNLSAVKDYVTDTCINQLIPNPTIIKSQKELRQKLKVAEKEITDDPINCRNFIKQLESLSGKLGELETEMKPLKVNDLFETKAPFIKALSNASKVAMEFKSRAFFFAYGIFGLDNVSRIFRVATVNFENIASQYGNQIGARADALMKQVKEHEKYRKKLPLSVFLRDSKPTDFLNMYTWNRASGPATVPDMVFHPFDSFSAEETTDRVRAIEHLFSDFNWANINTVYASGQGDIRMALIKDEVGNWNLKSFDNDPTELLNAYTDMTRAALGSAVEIAASGGTGSGLKKAMELAGRLTRGQVSPSDANDNMNLEGARLTLIEQLNVLKVDAIQMEKGLSDEALKNHRAGTVKSIQDYLTSYTRALQIIQGTLSQN